MVAAGAALPRSARDAAAGSGIAATHLSAWRYRSFERYELDLDPATTVLVGHNAAGKTNLVEALQLLTAGVSFRRPSPAELVREGCDAGRIELALAGEGRLLEMACVLEQGRRAFERNGKRVRAAGIRGVLPSVLFCPDDLDMVKRSARVRREALDAFGIQLNAQYAKLVSAYTRTVEQRNNLLKEPSVDPVMLEVWDNALVSAAAALLMHRRALLERIRAHLVAACARIAPRECVDVQYVSTVGELAPGRAELEGQMASALAASRADDMRRGCTLVGPHRDEILFTIDGRPARDFGSQGQQRSLVLAWKLAEVRVTRDILGRYPLLLLDDVMSELDADRRAAMLEQVEEGIQTVITTTNLGYFADDMLRRAKVVHVDEA